MTEVLAAGHGRHAGSRDAVRVLYSFPGKLGADRIDYTAWEQVRGLNRAGAEVTAWPGVLHRELDPRVSIRPTLVRGRVRLPYRVLGRLRTFDLHDRIVARRLLRSQRTFDVVHTWPLGAYHTLLAARELGIPSVLERPNTHTRHAYETVRRESERLGVELPPDNEHAFNEAILAREEREYAIADYLLCPSDAVARTFVEAGFDESRILRHAYGYDDATYFPAARDDESRPFTMLFAGVAAVRKGLHFALEAWLRSPVHRTGRFLVAGTILPAYAEKLAPQLADPSVHVLGHRHDVPELMREADALVLPSIEEGSALVCAEAIGSGCIPLVSDATSGACVDGVNSLVHAVGDVAALTRDITKLADDPSLRDRLRAGCLQTAPGLTWDAAGRRLVDLYRSVGVPAHR